MKITHILGDWSRNIGNAFFQLGGYYVLQKILPDAHFALISEPPGYPSYWNPGGGTPANFFDMASVINTDALVLMGPMFRAATPKIWGKSLEKVLSSGVRLILLGVAAMKYGREDIKSYRDFLKNYPPYILTSRDTETYESLGDLAEHAYDGIDLAFFLPDLYNPIGFKSLSPFIVLNFDKIPEPVITLAQEPGVSFQNENPHLFDTTFEFGGGSWKLKFPNIRTNLASISRYFMFLEGLLWRGSRLRELGSYKVIRADHRSHPLLRRKTYRSPNVLVNDTPYPYLELYSQADLTLSNRVHACVASLSYGKAAMLFSSSPRIRMLDRLGLADITQRPVCLDLSVLEREKRSLVSFLRDCLSE